MRLIDADELRKCAIPCEIHNGALTELCIPLYQLDNAPTVPLPDFKEGYKQAIIDGKTNFSRPQGEWITQEQGAFYPIECSNRHNEPFCGDEGYVLSNFCPECGAKMKKGGEEE